jgi:hypothetical protein
VASVASIGELMKRPLPPASNETSTEAVTCGPSEHARRATKEPPGEEAFVRAAALFRAAGDVARLKLLVRLSDGEWCVTELANASVVETSLRSC